MKIKSAALSIIVLTITLFTSSCQKAQSLWELEQYDAHMDDGDYDQALVSINKVIAFDPIKDFYYRRRGNCQIYLQHYKEALQDFDKAIELEPTDCTNYFGRGEVLHLMKNYKGAKAAWDKGLSMPSKIGSKYIDDKVNSRGYTGRAKTLIELHDLTGALKDATKAAIINPENDQALLIKATANRLLKNYKQALEDNSKAIAIDNEDSDNYLARALTYKALNQPIKALVDLNKTLELDEENVDALEARASIYDDMGKKDLALKDRKTLVDLKQKS